MVVLPLACVQKRQKHIYLLVGQSNMAGRGSIEAIDIIEHPQVYMFTQDKRWVKAREPMHFDRPDRVGTGPGFAFGRAMAKANPDSDIYLVPCAVGGSRIEKWGEGIYYKLTDSYPYDEAIMRTREALKDGGELKGILWHQGESDSRLDRYKPYKERLIELMKRFREDLDAKDVPIVLGEIGRFHAKRRPQADSINSILAQAPEFIPFSAVVNSEGLTDQGDSTHFDSPSYRELGNRYAIKMLALQKTRGYE